MDKRHGVNSELLRPTRGDLHNLDREKEIVRRKISETLKSYHRELNLFGKPQDYILTVADAINALSSVSFITPPKSQAELSGKTLKTFYKTSSLNEVLAGIGLPHKPIKEF